MGSSLRSVARGAHSGTTPGGRSSFNRQTFGGSTNAGASLGGGATSRVGRLVSSSAPNSSSV